MCTPRASASTSSGCSYSRSIRSRTRRSRARSRRCCVEAAWGLTPAALRKELREKEVNKHIYNAIKENRCGGSVPTSSVSPLLAEAHYIARWVAKRAVADAVALVHRLLEHLRTGSAHVLEGGVAVVGSEDDGAQHALGQELRHHLLVLRLGDRIGRRPLEHDVDVGLCLRAHRHPGHALVLGVVANVETKDVAVERQGFGVVVDSYKAVRDFQFHIPHVR